MLGVASGSFHTWLDLIPGFHSVQEQALDLFPSSFIKVQPVSTITHVVLTLLVVGVILVMVHRAAKHFTAQVDVVLATTGGWLAAEPDITALAIVGRLARADPATFGGKQHSTVQRLLRSLRRKAAETLLAAVTEPAVATESDPPATADGATVRAGCRCLPLRTPRAERA